ncbi:flavin reductase family protein [Sneathiella limimaris]|uniref:flavin reductase family protein n=1 Tax=Sneathiella limimaris TaxID=1964213 RepID=UPI00146CF5DA|nr:flavin reductase family protein [Sneathiella limimaris]
MFYKTSDHHGMKHNPFKALVSPRPIGWISTQSTDGELNLAPFSFFNAMAESPPVLAMAFTGNHIEGGAKDSLSNIRETGEFVVNMVTYELRDAMNASSEMVGRAVNEFELAGLTPVPSEIVKPPRVKESPVNMECKLLQVIDLPTSNPEVPNIMVLGQAHAIHISDDIITDGMVDMSKYHPLARLGYRDYTAVMDVFSLDRPDQARQDRTHR